MAIMEVLLRARIDGELSVNKFNYVSSGGSPEGSLSFNLANAMGFVLTGGVFPAGTIMDWLWTNLTNNFVFDEVQVRDIYSLTDFYTLPFAAGTAGQAAGDSLPPFAAYGFRSNRIRSDIRRGTRRFAGVNESVVGDGGILTAPGITLVNTMATRMSATLTVSADPVNLEFDPAVLSKEEYTAPSGNPAYRYYSTSGEQLDHAAVGVTWEPYTAIRSQVSRQYGRGA